MSKQNVEIVCQPRRLQAYVPVTAERADEIREYLGGEDVREMALARDQLETKGWECNVEVGKTVKVRRPGAAGSAHVSLSAVRR